MNELNMIDCKNATAPINLSMSKIMGPCSLKCDYNYVYGKYTPNVTNKKEYLSLNYSGKSNPVKYNNEYYNVQEIRMYIASLHQYDGKFADGEILIIHNGPGKNLIVSIPLVIGDKTDLGSVQLNNLISESNKRIPNEGESATISFGDFSLDNFIPKKVGFYSYNGTLPYKPCNGNYQYILYDKKHALNIAKKHITNLVKNVKKHKVEMHKNTFFYNKKGANLTNADDNIYIDCQPVDEEGNIYINESTNQQVTAGDGTMNIDFEKIEPFMYVFVGLIVASVILYGGKYLLKKLKKD